MSTRLISPSKDPVLFSVYKAKKSIGLAAIYAKALDETLPRRSHFLGTYRSIRNESLRGFTRGYIYYTADVIGDSYSATLSSTQNVEWLMELFMRNGRESEVCPLLTEFSTVDAALIEARETVLGLRPYLPLVTRTEMEEDDVRTHGRKVHERLHHLHLTLDYARDYTNDTYRFLRDSGILRNETRRRLPRLS